METPDMLAGGNSNRVFRDGNTVIRDVGSWSPFVHQLLRYLTTRGFNESPALIARSGSQETLSFIDGEAGNDPLKPFMQSDAILAEAARLLRRFHDLTQDFEVPPGTVVRQATHTDHEVICHNDFAPYNCIFRDNHIVGLIDFDMAAPGSRLWDIAYAVYRFVPLATDRHCHDQGWQSIPDRAGRLRLFCNTYGLDDRAALIPTVIRRLDALVEFMTATSSNLDHIPIYLEDMCYIREHQAAWRAAFLG